MDKVLKKIEKDLKINLIAKQSDDAVNGYTESRVSGNDIELDITLYDEDKDPDYEVYVYKGVTYNKGSKITKRKTTIDKEKVKNLGAKEHDII